MEACFERAADLGLLYLQGQDNNSAVILSSATSLLSTTTSMTDIRRMSAILETALQRAPIILIKTGKLQLAIERYRIMLTAIETRTTQSLRLTLARQLAEVLLRGVSGTIYTPPSNLSPSRSLMASGGNSTAVSKQRLWEPKKYSGRNQFIPKNPHEETILLLLISEALAVRDAVLSQSPEFRVARAHALGNATAIYDLLTLATVRWNQVALLHDSFEKALKFSFGEQHVWRQYALTLTSLGRHSHALIALKESSKLSPGDNLPSLISAKICYEHLGTIKEGIDFAQQALRNEIKRTSRAQLYVGIGLQQISISSTLKSDKMKYSKLALEALEKAIQIDSNDHLTEYYLACQYSLTYNIPEALHHIKIALQLRTEHASSLHLFALLLTANRRPREALCVINDALEEFPDNINLLHVKAHLELYLQDAETAVISVQKMLILWKELYESQTSSNEHDTERYSDTRSVMHLQQSSQMSDKDSSE